MGIGQALARPWRRALPRGLLLLGTMFPDLVDKPVYYGLALLTGRRGAELGLLSGTRTFGHTLLLLLLLAAVAGLRRSRALAALAVGSSTHLLLDGLSEMWGSAAAVAGPGFASVLLFPLLGLRFPVTSFGSMGEHLLSVGSPLTLLAELLGAALLVHERRRWARRTLAEGRS